MGPKDTVSLPVTEYKDVFFLNEYQYNEALMQKASGSKIEDESLLPEGEYAGGCEIDVNT